MTTDGQQTGDVNDYPETAEQDKQVVLSAGPIRAS